MLSRAGLGDFLVGIFKKGLRAGGPSAQEGDSHERGCGHWPSTTGPSSKQRNHMCLNLELLVW